MDTLPPTKPPGTLRRFSSRIKGLDGFLRDRLRGARQYDRIAGYFRSSIFEIAAEELVTVGRIRFVCNSDLNPADLRASKEARTSALLQKWWAGGTADAGRPRIPRQVIRRVTRISASERSPLSPTPPPYPTCTIVERSPATAKA